MKKLLTLWRTFCRIFREAYAREVEMERSGKGEDHAKNRYEASR